MSLNKTQLVSEVAASAGIPKTVSEKAVTALSMFYPRNWKEVRM
jgi:hypothetical protein